MVHLFVKRAVQYIDLVNQMPTHNIHIHARRKNNSSFILILHAILSLMVLINRLYRLFHIVRSSYCSHDLIVRVTYDNNPYTRINILQDTKRYSIIKTEIRWQRRRKCDKNHVI